MAGTVLINGEPSDGRIPVTDSSVLRGDGCFEVLRAYDGRPFRLDDHLERLQSSARALGIPLPRSRELAAWVGAAAAEVGDGAVRVVVTRGPAVPEVEGSPLVIVFSHPWPRAEGPAMLYPVIAPWHAAGLEWDLAGAKTISYAPNLAAARRAEAEGFAAALLVTPDQVVLEGPTFSVGWVVDGNLETPTLELGILDSITRRVVLDSARRAGIGVVEGKWHLDRLGEAAEVLVFSTIREVQPVIAVGSWQYQEGPVTRELSASFAAEVGRSTGTGGDRTTLEGT